MTDSVTRSVVVEREFPHPAEKIWRALTQAPLIAEWLAENDFQPVLGHRFTLRAPPNPQWNGITDCEVLVIEPLKRLAYSWNATGAEAATGPRTIVTFTLTPTKTGTHLRMEHSGFRPEHENNYRGAGYGWQRFFAAIERVVAGLA
jgi:uncharacterized protein YndB with AHSA1/START domain